MRNHNHAWRALLGGAVVAGLIAGCGSSGAATGGSSGGSGGGFAGTISIGYINDLSGLYQTIGYPAGNGALVAVNLVNSAGGVKVDGKRYRLQLKTCEANSDSSQAVACAQKLVRDDGVKFVMGAQGSEAPPVAAITDPAGVLFINPSTALAQEISKYKYVYNPLDGIDLKIRLAAEAIKRTFPDVKTVAAVTANDPTGAALPLFVAALKKEGIRLVDTQSYDETALDVTSQLTDAKAAHPDLLFLGWTQAEVAPAIKANQTIHAAPNIYGWTGPGACQAYASQLAGVKFLSSELFGVDLSHPTNPVARKYVAAYKKFVTSNPAAAKNPVNIPNMTYSLEYADAIPQLAKAISAAGTFTDVPKIAAALETTSINGVQGVVKYGPDRSAVIGQEHCTVNVTGPGATSVFSVAP
jgi:ABC-type branched-subunit amino acid transport system substrate-binding protein